MQRASMLRCKPPSTHDSEHQYDGDETNAGSFPVSQNTFLVDDEIDEDSDYSYYGGSKRSSPRQLLRKLRCTAHAPRCGSSSSSKRRMHHRPLAEDEDSENSLHYQQNQQLVEDVFLARTPKLNSTDNSLEMSDEAAAVRSERLERRQQEGHQLVNLMESHRHRSNSLESIEEEPPPAIKALVLGHSDDEDEELLLFEHSVGDDSSSGHLFRTTMKLSPIGRKDRQPPAAGSPDLTAPLTDEASERNQSLESADELDAMGVTRVTTYDKNEEKIVDFNPVAENDTQEILRNMDTFIETVKTKERRSRTIPSLMSRIEKLEALLKEEEALDTARSTGTTDGALNSNNNMPAARPNEGETLPTFEKKREVMASPKPPRPPRASPTLTTSSVTLSSSAAPPSFSSMVLDQKIRPSPHEACKLSKVRPSSNLTSRAFFWRSHPGVTYTSYGPQHTMPSMSPPRKKNVSPSRQPFVYPAVIRRAHFAEGGDYQHHEMEPALGDWVVDEEERVSFFSDSIQLQVESRTASSGRQQNSGLGPSDAGRISITGSWVDFAMGERRFSEA